jgi:type VI secretion system protein ImpG
MSFNTYYRDELSYLRDVGALFARANPRLSSYLGRQATDPDVERLLEGFAFLVGRLRQRLDAEMPEVVLSLLQLVWPHYLRPTPPMTTIRFAFADNAGGLSIPVPRGTEVQSRPVDGEPVVFRTSYDVTVLPFLVDGVDLVNRQSTSRLSLTFRRLAGSGLQPLAEAPITLFFNSPRDPGLSHLLLLFFMRRVRRVQFIRPGADPVDVPIEIEPVGYTAKEATLPYPDNGFSGFRIMQEYFACPEKFAYVRLKGLDRFAELPVDTFTLAFEMSQRFNDTSRVAAENFELNATPAINLFSAEGQALMISHDRTEYPVRAIGGREKRSVHAIEQVTGWVQGSGRRIDYVPFETFRHDLANPEDETLYFRTHVRPSVFGDGIDHYLSFATRLNAVGLPETETISLRLTCSNGALASKLGIGSVDRPTSTTPSKLDFENITPVLSEVPPPLDDSLLWTLVANLARNFASLIDVDALRTVVGAYDFRAFADKQAAQQRDLLLRSFRSFERRGVDIINRGRPVRAHEVVLSVSEGQMGGEGEMYLFGSVLDSFLKSYTSINSLHRFSMQGVDANTLQRWSAKWGEVDAL